MDRLEAFIEENFREKTLVVVSNREPYVHKKTTSGIKVDSPAGGLTSAMDDVLRAVGGKWVAWGSGSADRESVDDGGTVEVPPENPSYTLRRVWLTDEQVNNYYHGFSNRVLWPLCHIALDKVYYLQDFWDGYQDANRAFADAVVDEVEPRSIVWVHDYHLCLAPEMIRRKRPELTLVHFWHIPWPDWGVFRVCPRSREILEGLLANDIIGFQIPIFAKNFMDCVRESMDDAEVDYENSRIIRNGHTTWLKAFPISVDYEMFDTIARENRTESSIQRIKSKHRLKGLVGVGVDRLEYTKALLKRLQAISYFFEKNPDLRGKFTFIQVAVPTRTEEPYISYRKGVEDLVSKINYKFGTRDWTPVVYIDEKIEQKNLVAYYRMADVAIISSIYDGMNLVAKEYVASQVDENGALILSEMAGAADELEGAILVNPYDVEDFAESIRRALVMPPEEKSVRMDLLRKQVREADIYKWVWDILKEMLRVSAMKTRKSRYLFDHTEELRKEASGKSMFLFLDYDGTLTPIVETPQQAFMPERVRELVEGISSRMPVAIISGRGLDDVKDRVAIPGIIYAGNHGAEVWDGEKTVVSQNLAVNRETLEEVLEKLKEALTHIPGVLIEDKGVTASIHFRNVKVRDLAGFFDLFSKTVKDYEETFRITSGKKVFEIRPLDIWNKGDAVSWIEESVFKGGGERFLVYIGDDTTDEDAYRAIRGKGISISIGGSPESDYYLKDQQEIERCLEFLEELAPGAGSPA